MLKYFNGIGEVLGPKGGFCNDFAGLGLLKDFNLVLKDFNWTWGRNFWVLAKGLGFGRGSGPRWGVLVSAGAGIKTNYYPSKFQTLPQFLSFTRRREKKKRSSPLPLFHPTTLAPIEPVWVDPPSGGWYNKGEFGRWKRRTSDGKTSQRA